MNISIIIPAINEAEGIGVAIDGAWKAGASEVIVVDGGSCDATMSIARDRGCRLIESPPGRAIQQNVGARQASGDVLLFQHADNWLEAGAVDQIEAALVDQAVLGGVFRQHIEADGCLFRLLERGNALRATWLGLPYGDQGIFLRREVFERLGRFPEVGLMEDLMLMRKFRRRAQPVLLPGPLHVSARRWRRYGVIRQTLRNWYLLSAYRLGVPPDRLATYYARHDSWQSDRG